MCFWQGRGNSREGPKEDVTFIQSREVQNSPELDEEGYSIRPEEPGSTKGKHFYSSSESEEEEESHKKFNIKIKPLQSKDILKNAATVDELKASIGNIALSPSPVVKKWRDPGAPHQLQNL